MPNLVPDLVPSLVSAAARNNAVFCDRLCRAQGLASRFLPGLWRAGRGAPPLTPDAVTLPGEAGPPPLAELRALLAANPSGLTVKDSARALDLTPDGFAPLFDAEWIACPAPIGRSPLQMVRLSAPADLALWESLWRRGESLPEGHTQFPVALLARADFAVMAHVGRDARPRAGALLLASAGVVQISNIFTLGPQADALFRSLATSATRLWPGLPVVGYEHGPRLAAARAAGFSPIGPLRVWQHPGDAA